MGIKDLSTAYKNNISLLTQKPIEDEISEINLTYFEN